MDGTSIYKDNSEMLFYSEVGLADLRLLLPQSNAVKPNSQLYYILVYVYMSHV